MDDDPRDAGPAEMRTEQTAEGSAQITAAIAEPHALRVKCMGCGGECIAFDSPTLPRAAPPRYVEMAALFCRGCDLVLCSRCAGTVGSGAIGGGVCTGCGRGLEPADVSELVGTGVRVIGPM